MKLDYFADGIANVSITAGVVRIDFYVTHPGTEANAAEGQRDIHLSVNLPLTTFVNSMNVLERVMGQLIERGVVTANRPGEPRTPPA
jgi:hypothetical protein